MTDSLEGGAAAAPLSMRAAATLTSAAVKAARQLAIDLERGRRIDAAVLRSAMEAAFGASDATGVWNWKTAYDVCETATILFLRKFGPAMRVKAGSPAAMLPMLARSARCRRVRVMGTHRIELSGFNDTMRDRLRAYGLFGEIISWKLRMFVPTDADGVDVIARVLDCFPIERIGERKAA
jgi:hypothetical protein